MSSTEYSVNKVNNLQTLQPIIKMKVVSKGVANRIAGSGLKLQHLKLTFERGGYEGLGFVLKEKVNGKVKILKSRRKIT